MKHILLMTLMFMSWTTYAQHGALHGMVLDRQGQPIPAANIVLKGTRYGTTTNPEGTYVINHVREGNYTLVVSLVGHESVVQAIAVVADQDVEVANITLSEKQQQLNEVVVSGLREGVYVESKPSESLRITADLIEVPQSINVATKQTLQDMGMLSKGEIARVSSGITRSYGGNLDMTLQIRGTNATFGTFRNGVGGPIWWNAQEDANMIERVEFVKGPAGFMLANSEPGGLVNTVTKQPTRERTGEVSFGVGSYNMMRTALDLGGEMKKGSKLTYRLNVGAQNNNDYFHFSDFTRVFVAPALRYDFSENTSLTVEYNYVNA
ncbi:MAG: carboxypeptidase-like regulatory domain-containing protein [Chryseolinea sp.]